MFGGFDVLDIIYTGTQQFIFEIRVIIKLNVNLLHFLSIQSKISKTGETVSL